MFQDKVLEELIPIRGIEHKINFILRVVVPNKLAYRVNSTENKEVQRQMEKGYIQESLNPYSIPVLIR